MALVFGRVGDMLGRTLNGRAPILRFHPRAETGSMSLRADRFLSHRPVDAVIQDYDWTADLTITLGTVPLTWYELELIELDLEGNFTRSWWWGARVHVPPEGGQFNTLPGGPMSPESVWVGLTPPPSGWRGYWLYSPGTGESMPLDDPAIGDLRRVN